MPDKLTDSEIVKALETLFELVLYEGYLQRAKTISNALDLILRGLVDTQKAENERLEKEVFTYKIRRAKAEVRETKAKAEAYKEFAERLKRNEGRRGVPIGTIDNLLKELVGDKP